LSVVMSLELPAMAADILVPQRSRQKYVGTCPG